MWIKRVDGSYYNMTTGATFSIYPTGGAYGISANNTGAPVANGFSTEEEAQEALDTFMNEVGHETISNGS